jgi:hypothetical protein
MALQINLDDRIRIESGEGCQPLQFLFGPLALGDVAVDRNEADYLSLGIAYEHCLRIKNDILS